MYFADRNPRGMFNILEPLHDLIEKGAETLKEQSFMQHFGRDLAEAKECCNRYQQQGNARELSQAWDLYYQVLLTWLILKYLHLLNTFFDRFSAT